MAIDTSAVSRMAKTIALGLEYSSPILVAGVTKVPEVQMNGKRMGETYDFVVDDITAAEFGGATNLQDGISSRKVSLSVKNYGTKIGSKQVQSALDLGDKGELAKKVGVAIADAAAMGVWNQALTSGVEIVITGTNNVEKKVIGAAADIRGDYNEKIYGFINPSAKTEIISKADAVQPTDMQKEYKGGVGSYYDIDELFTVKLPKSSAGATMATDQITSSSKVGDTVTLAGATAGKWYVFDGKAVVVATSSTKGVIAKPAVTSTNASSVYAPVWLRAEGSQAFGDCGSLLDCCKETSDAQGLTIAYNEKDNGSFSKDMEWGCAIVAGVADKKAQRIVLIPA